MATFADANTPTVLEATKDAGIPCKAFFKFNNSALFASNETAADSEDINAMFWMMGQKFFLQTLQKPKLEVNFPRF